MDAKRIVIGLQGVPIVMRLLVGTSDQLIEGGTYAS
jgi:hypothetical protein